MKAMILAAGRGSRLRPLTDTIPKALVPIMDRPALEWNIRRLEKLGFQQIIINAWYFAEQIEEFVHQRTYGASLTLSKEETLLGTGGGVLQTRNYWDDSPFLLHNVDIFSDVDVLQAYEKHRQSKALATLFTQERSTQKKLLIDQEERVCGIHDYRNKEYRLLRTPQGTLKEHGFSGIHIISPQIFSMIEESGEFSIIDLYLRLIQQGEKMISFDMQSAYWKDIGTPEKYEALQQDWHQNPHLRKLYCA